MADTVLENLYPDTYGPICDLIDTGADPLMFMIGSTPDKLDAWSNSFNSWIKEQTKFIEVALKKLEDWIKMVDKLASSNFVPDLINPEFINGFYLKNPALRRYSGEAMYWQMWEVLQSANNGVEGMAQNFKDTYKKWLKQMILSYIDNINFRDINSFVQKLVIYGIIPWLHVKIIPGSWLPSWIYPQVTTISKFKTEQSTQGKKPRPANWIAPVLAMPDPTDPNYELFETTRDLSVLKKPLINAAIYNKGRAYWSSNWREFNIPAINGSRIGYINKYGIPVLGPFFDKLASESSGGRQGPRLLKQMNHRISYESAYPQIDSKGQMTGSMPWSQIELDKNTHKGAFNIPFDGSSSKSFDIPRLSNMNPMFKLSKQPPANNWAIIDFLYEIQMLMVSTKGVCNSYVNYKKRWEDLLKGLGFEEYMNTFGITSDYMWNHISDDALNDDPTKFGTSIINHLLKPLYVLEDQLNSKINYLRSSIQSW